MHYSLEAETSVLGACMISLEAYPQIQGMLSPDDFYRGEHRSIFGALVALDRDGKPLDALTVAEYLEVHSPREGGWITELVNMADSTPSAANVEAYAGIIRSRSTKRRLASLCREMAERVDTGEPEELIAEMQAGIDTLTQGGIGRALDFLDVMSRADEAIENATKSAKTGVPVGVPTGLPALDRRIGGLLRGRLNVLAARPSLGKTAFALQVALHAARHDRPVGFCSLEMGADELGIRSYANVLEVNGTGLQFGDPEMVQAYTRKLKDHPMTRYRIYVDDFSYGLNGIIARAHEWRHKHGIELLIVDYLQLIEGLAGETQTIRIGQATRSLKKLAKRLNIAVLLLSQLNRDMEKHKRRPQLSDLRDSGNIEQDCDVALFLHSDDDDGTDGPVNVEIGVLKTRYGRRGWLPQRFQFDGRTQRFMEAYPYAA